MRMIIVCRGGGDGELNALKSGIVPPISYSFKCYLGDIHMCTFPYITAIITTINFVRKGKTNRNMVKFGEVSYDKSTF
jgi:hypothetical protein